MVVDVDLESSNGYVLRDGVYEKKKVTYTKYVLSCRTYNV